MDMDQPIDVLGGTARQRRRWLTAGLAALAVSRVRAQPAGGPWRIGVLHPGRPPGEPGGALDRFRRALRELGLSEGRHLRLELRFDEFQMTLLQQQVAELVESRVDLIVAGTTGAAQAAQRLTRSIPIVMAVSADPVADGLVASLARPGGNVTGMSIMTPELTGRRLQLLRDTLPGLMRVGLMLDTRNPRWPVDLQEHEAAAQSLGLQLSVAKVASADDFAAAFEAARQQQVQALVLAQSTSFAMARAQLAALALAQKLPAVSGSGDAQFARAGGLMSYGANIAVSWERAAHHVQRILAGARPGDLPIERPSRFELAVNMRTAETLGLKLPPQVLLLADEVIR